MDALIANHEFREVGLFVLGVVLGFVMTFGVRTIRIIEGWEKAKMAHRTNQISRSWRRSSKRDSINPCGKE